MAMILGHLAVTFATLDFLNSVHLYGLWFRMSDFHLQVADTDFQQYNIADTYVLVHVYEYAARHLRTRMLVRVHPLICCYMLPCAKSINFLEDVWLAYFKYFPVNK